jgi:hypothetical protein
MVVLLVKAAKSKRFSMIRMDIKSVKRRIRASMTLTILLVSVAIVVLHSIPMIQTIKLIIRLHLTLTMTLRI